MNTWMDEWTDYYYAPSADSRLCSERLIRFSVCSVLCFDCLVLLWKPSGHIIEASVCCVLGGAVGEGKQRMRGRGGEREREKDGENGRGRLTKLCCKTKKNEATQKIIDPDNSLTTADK